jgi:hypothetical protein
VAPAGNSLEAGSYSSDAWEVLVVEIVAFALEGRMAAGTKRNQIEVEVASADADSWVPCYEEDLEDYEVEVEVEEVATSYCCDGAADEAYCSCGAGEPDSVGILLERVERPEEDHILGFFFVLLQIDHEVCSDEKSHYALEFVYFCWAAGGLYYLCVECYWIHSKNRKR